MIEDKELGLKVAENPEEALLRNTLEISEKHLRETKLGLELEEVVIKYLKKKLEPASNA